MTNTAKLEYYKNWHLQYHIQVWKQEPSRKSDNHVFISILGLTSDISQISLKVVKFMKIFQWQIINVNLISIAIMQQRMDTRNFNHRTIYTA